MPEDPYVVFVPRHTLAPDEPFRLLRNPDGGLCLAVARGATITADFVDLLIDITQQRNPA